MSKPSANANANASASANVEALSNFDTCDIGDALVRLKQPFGGYLDGISMWSPVRQGTAVGNTTVVVGEVVTVKMVPASDTSSPKPSTHFADANEAGKVMFISQPAGMYSACFGGLMAARARYLGAAGVVVDGRFRDMGEIQGMGLALFAREPSVLGTNTFTRPSEINVPVRFNNRNINKNNNPEEESEGELWVHPNDIIVGDHNGVVVVPSALVGEVVRICEERKACDEKIMEAVNGGETMAAAMKRFR